MCSAAAQIRLHGRSDLVVAGRRGPLYQRLRSHDHAGDAVAALRCLPLDEGLLRDPRMLPTAEPFDGRDPAPGDGGNRRYSGEHRCTVDHHRTGSALPEAAAELRAVELESVTEHIQQGRAGIVSGFHGSAVHDESSHRAPTDNEVSRRSMRAAPRPCEETTAAGTEPFGTEH